MNDSWDILGLQFVAVLFVVIAVLLWIDHLIDAHNQQHTKRTPYTDARSSIDAWRRQQQERRREQTR